MPPLTTADQAISAGPELFIGLVGAVGSDLKTVTDHLSQELRRANYESHLIHLSDLMLDCAESIRICGVITLRRLDRCERPNQATCQDAGRVVDAEGVEPAGMSLADEGAAGRDR